MSLSYTVGDWTITDQVTDTVVLPKNLPVPDLSFATDFAVSSNQPDEAVLMNITGTSLMPPESLRYARTPVKDVYANSDIAASQRHAVKAGTRTLCEVRFNLQAVNSVSGEEIYLPVRGWVCLQLPLVNLMTPEAVQYALTRTVGASLATGAIDGSLETQIARGDLIPD